ncbi:GLH-binding kinase 1 [Aphelenchoides fujianensis]|nr:GLH-binding kinase 1 [Aphelenchoides fujianensis]
MPSLKGKFRYVEGLGCQLPIEFEEVQLLGEGTQADVFTARHGRWENVAIKRHKRPFEDIKTAENACREYFLIQSISHPCIADLRNAFTPAKSLTDFYDFYMVASLSGKTLETWLQSKECMYTRDAYIIMYQILAALAYLHEHDIIHRDLHPHNIVVDTFLKIKLIDFGLSTEDTSGRASTKELSQYVIAKLYRAPEVIREERYTKSVDIWAAGCIFYRLFNREPLFKGPTENDVLAEQYYFFGGPDHKNKAKATVETLWPDELIIPMDEVKCDYTGVVKPGTVRHMRLNEARDLFLRMMSINPAARISALDGLSHSFIRAEKMYLPYVPQKLSYSLGDAVFDTVTEWKMMLFDHLKKQTDPFFLPTSAWIPSFQSKCEKDTALPEQHVISYDQCAFRPFNEQKLVVRVLLADYRKAVEVINQPVYNNLLLQDRYEQYVDLIYSTDLDFEKRYQKYATDIQQLMEMNSNFPLLIIDDSDLRGWEWFCFVDDSNALAQRVIKHGCRLESFIEELNRVKVGNYEMHFPHVVLYPYGRITSEESPQNILAPLKHTVARLPVDLTFAVIAAVKHQCKNVVSIAESVLYCKHNANPCTIILCPKSALRVSQNTEENSAKDEDEPQPSTSFLVRTQTDEAAVVFSRHNEALDAKQCANTRVNDTIYFWMEETKGPACNERAAFNPALNQERCNAKATISEFKRIPKMRLLFNKPGGFMHNDSSFFGVFGETKFLRVYEPKNHKCKEVEDFVVLNSTTIIVLEWEWLILVRLSPAEEQYEAIVLEESHGYAYVFTEITGTNVNVQQAVLNQDYAEEMRFARLDIDKPCLQMEWSCRVNVVHQRCVYNYGKAGLLYGMRRDIPTRLFTFYLSKKRWTVTTTSSLTQDVPTSLWTFSKLTDEHKSPEIRDELRLYRARYDTLYWSPNNVYCYTLEVVNGALQYPIHQCSLEKPKWKRIAVVSVSKPIEHIFVETDDETGDDKLLAILHRNGGNPGVENFPTSNANTPNVKRPANNLSLIKLSPLSIAVGDDASDNSVKAAERGLQHMTTQASEPKQTEETMHKSELSDWELTEKELERYVVSESYLDFLQLQKTGQQFAERRSKGYHSIGGAAHAQDGYSEAKRTASLPNLPTGGFLDAQHESSPLATFRHNNSFVSMLNLGAGWDVLDGSPTSNEFVLPEARASTSKDEGEAARPSSGLYKKLRHQQPKARRTKMPSLPQH